MAGIDFAHQPQLHYRYALDLAISLGCSLDLCTAFHPNQIKGRLRSTKDVQVLEAHFQQRMRELHPAPPLSPLPPEVLDTVLRKKEVRQGLPEEELQHFAQEEEIDLMLLNVNGFNYPFREEFGKVVLQISQDALCTVLLLPEDMHFRGFKKILFLCDEPPTSPLLQEHITGAAFLFGAEIHYMQVIFNTNGVHTTPAESFNTAIQNILPGVNANYTVTPFQQLVLQLNKYLQTYDIDLLYFMCPSRHFWPNFARQQLKHHYPLSRTTPIIIQHLD